VRRGYAVKKAVYAVRNGARTQISEIYFHAKQLHHVGNLDETEAPFDSTRRGMSHPSVKVRALESRNFAPQVNFVACFVTVMTKITQPLSPAYARSLVQKSSDFPPKITHLDK